MAACLALAFEMVARSAGGLADPATAAAARLAVVSLSLCPAMSLLGAKRPQHGVWQFIVATLAFVLVLPAVSARLVRPGSLPDIHLIERGFMPVLVFVGWLNFAGTRRAVAATCVAIGQVLLMRGFLPGASIEMTTAGGLDVLAAGLFACGAAVAATQAVMAGHRDGRATAAAARSPLAAAVDPPFLALRETLGAAWALRLAEGFDALASKRGWPCRLGFGGMEEDVADDVAWHRDALQAFRSLARRFVDDDWLVRHGWPTASDGDRPQSVHPTP